MDIFDSEITLPATMYIVCPGPGAATYDTGSIPDARTIAVNAAINLVTYARFWMVADSNAVNQGWYTGWSGNPPKDAPPPFIDHAGGERYTFSQGEPLGADIQFKHGYLRPNGSVLLQALQLCYWFQAGYRNTRNVNIIGADMRGDSYYDGKIVPEYMGRDVWPYVSICRTAIAFMRGEGWDIRFSTPSAIEE